VKISNRFLRPPPPSLKPLKPMVSLPNRQVKHKRIVCFFHMRLLCDPFHSYSTLLLFTLYNIHRSVFLREKHCIFGEVLYDVFPMVSLEIFIDIILPAALWLWARLSL
jgi:hypothetical protein